MRLNQSFIASSSGGACAWQVWNPVYEEAALAQRQVQGYRSATHIDPR